jgi:hypothetical protein
MRSVCVCMSVIEKDKCERILQERERESERMQENQRERERAGKQIYSGVCVCVRVCDINTQRCDVK